MTDSYHITMNDCSPLPTEDDMKAFAEKLGVTYDEFISALDSGFYTTSDILEYVKKLRNE